MFFSDVKGVAIPGVPTVDEFFKSSYLPIGERKK